MLCLSAILVDVLTVWYWVWVKCCSCNCLLLFSNLIIKLPEDNDNMDPIKQTQACFSFYCVQHRHYTSVVFVQQAPLVHCAQCAFALTTVATVCLGVSNADVQNNKNGRLILRTIVYQGDLTISFN